MFNGTGQSGVLFSNTQGQNLFGQTQGQQTGLFGASNTVVNGTTIKYTPLAGTDTIQKNNQSVNVQTKLNCISAMKEYESKSLEELRFDDYSANRIFPQKNISGIFGSNQTSSGLFSNQSSMFQSNSTPFGSNQSTNMSGTTNQLFGANNQNNAFGSKTLFGAGTSSVSTNSTFGSFNNQSKPATLFGMNTSTANKPLFGASQPTQSTSLFGGQQTSTPSLFGNQPSTQSTGFFGGLGSQAQQTNQPTGLFNSNTSTSSFGFQLQPSNGNLFGNANNVAKPFGAGTNTSFSFNNTNSQTTQSLFGTSGTMPTGGLFSQNSTNQVFGSSPKQPLFSNQSTFNAPASSQTQSLFPQSSTGFGQTANNMFTNIQSKPNQLFGNQSVFNNTAKPSLFGTSTSTATGFGGQSTSLFGNFGNTSQSFGSTITTTTAVPVCNSFPIGVTTPVEALLQQQMAQQKILSLVSNRPYGVNKLFMNQNLDMVESTKAPVENGVHNVNRLHLVIKGNESDPNSSGQRRRILNQKTKVIPNQVYKIFSGFDEDDDISTKSNNIDNFLTKRENWKYLPPSAFEKSRKSLNIRGSFQSVDNNSDFLSNINCSVTESSLVNNIGSPLTVASQMNKDISKNYCSTPLSDNSLRLVEINLPTQSSPIHNGKSLLSTPTHYSSASKQDSFLPIRNYDSNETSIKLSELKEESIAVRSNIRRMEKSPKIIPNKDNGDQNSTSEQIDKRGGNLGVGKVCQVKLTNEGYYTEPTVDVLDKLVKVNENGDSECWVKNFIIGRNGIGSIRFHGCTNVYGLNLNELVSIKEKEVCVYPDDNKKPEEGEELNKPAQVILYNVWPTDKSNGEIINNEKRLLTMGFENKLKKSTERMGGRFISYKPENGIWIFEVEHFSKYTFIDSDDEDQVSSSDHHNSKNEECSKITMKREVKTATVESKNVSTVVDVVTTEADSMTTANRNDIGFQYRSAIDRLTEPANSRSLHHMKQSIFTYDSDEEIYDNDSLFRTDIEMQAMNKNLFYKMEQKDTDQPKSKKFETCEMGEQIYTSSQNNSQMMNYSNAMCLVSSDKNKITSFQNEVRRPIKPFAEAPLAPTSAVKSNEKQFQKLTIPIHLRDLQSCKTPYLYLKIMDYFDEVTVDVHKKYSKNFAFMQGNRFRTSFYNPSNIAGLNFFKKDTEEPKNCNSFNTMNKKSSPNSLMMMKCKYDISNYQMKLMKNAMSVSECSTIPEKCPLWAPSEGLKVLQSYLDVNGQMKNDSPSEEQIIFQRIISLCNSLWNDIDDGQKKELNSNMLDLARKQMFSKWIRMDCREKLIKMVKSLLGKSPNVDIDLWNDCILSALCSGEIQLACQLAIGSKQHRMSLLIAQVSSDLQSREIIKEQLNLWVQSKTDEHIPINVLCIYLILSGQTSIVLSDGTILTPLRQMSWVQALGVHFWYVQSYLGSIKSAVEFYDDAFKTESDIPCPHPISGSVTNEEQDQEEEQYPFFDCCYHLVKLYCDRLYDLDAILNPPTMSKNYRHKLGWDWSASWHVANFLTSIGYCKSIPAKICQEWAAQLERGNQWTMAAFALLHMDDCRIRTNLVKNLINRHVIESRQFSPDEQFLVESLHVPVEWIWEGKAIRCRAQKNEELEAFHRFHAKEFDVSHQLYIDHIVPRLVINDKHQKIKDIFHKFLITDSHKTLTNWHTGGDVYLKYIDIVSSLRVLKLTNKLANHSILMNDIEQQQIQQKLTNENRDLEEQLEKLKADVIRLLKVVQGGGTTGGGAGYQVISDAHKICKNQIVQVCNSFLQTCQVV